MLTVVTGAGGFVGSALARRMAETDYPGRVRLVDRSAPAAPGAAFESIAANLCEADALASALNGADCVIHLASLPGADAEAAPDRSRQINVDILLEMIALLSARDTPVRLVHASSIAVLGDALSALVTDETPPVPASTYGAHKRMAELAIVDAARRERIDSISLRLPGIVARPRGADGLGSAFMSDVFWAVQGGEALRLPVGPDATMWMMSARRCADALIHACTCLLPGWRDRALTLPALRARMGDLVDAIARETGRPANRIAYAPVAAVEARFGRLPPLRTARADTLGFRADEDLEDLVRAALACELEEVE